MRAPLAAVVASSVGGLLVWSEWEHWRASRRRLGGRAVAGGREAILVLGCRNRGQRANYLNRYRVRVALRSIDACAAETVLVFCGGAVGGEVPEADLLQQYACDKLGYAGPYLTDQHSRTTWENITNTADLLDSFDTVRVASNSLHAEKARAYIWKHQPDLAQRLISAKDYRLGELLLLKPLLAFLGLRNLQRLS
jgi:hypothetical protein